jgi:hypothetical protein
LSRHHGAQGLGHTSKQKRHGVCITTGRLA